MGSLQNYSDILGMVLFTANKKTQTNIPIGIFVFYLCSIYE